MPNILYTIGYAGFSIDEFIATLKKHQINVIIDVRSSPYSEYYIDYNKECLENRLKTENIYYRNYAKEFGARQECRDYYNTNGYLDFEMFSKSPVFQAGVLKLCSSVQKGFTIALMCAEKRPIDCHRAILVARAFYEKGYEVIHICPEDILLTQEEIHAQLLDCYYPNRDQFSFFRQATDDSLLLSEAYKKRNAEIGYRLEEN